jgi:hypothetical protein
MKGSCLCGAMEYEIDSIDTPVSHCLAGLFKKRTRPRSLPQPGYWLNISAG